MLARMHEKRREAAAGGGGQGGPQGEKQKIKAFQNCSLAKRPRVAHMFNHGWWGPSAGGWCRLAVGGWRRLAAVGGWRLVVGGGWWLAVGGGWQRLAAGGGCRSWRLAVGGPWGRSMRAVLSKKNIGVLKDPPWGGLGPKNLHQKWVDKISPIVNFVFLHDCHFGLKRLGAVLWLSVLIQSSSKSVLIHPCVPELGLHPDPCTHA